MNHSPVSTPELQKQLKHYRLSMEEYHKICQLIGREPLSVEWALFSALWSEHCSYKSSKVHLRKFAKTLDQKASGVGENAGIIDIGFGERIAFKMESHNHPSFIEPFQGAATGVGGILRDVFTMGARPIALANYLCFGEIEADRMKDLVRGVVHGISSYGNCVGVPTITGETQFFAEYNKNILVNALAVGYLGPQDPVSLSGAKGPGNFVVYVGAKTGKDGVHGAAMASESFDKNNDAKKPNIQIGDPYFEKLLIESCLEVIRENLVVAIQDMGAAGLTSSSFEMASKGQVGMIIELDQVPTRDLSIQPEELLLSESQERMLLVCEPQKLAVIQKCFSKWGLDAVKIGEVIPERKMRLQWKGEILTEIDPDLLVENAPVYERPFSSWSSKVQKSNGGSEASSISSVSELADQSLSGQREMKKFLSYKQAQKKYIYEQYDQRVGASTVLSSENSEIGLLRLPSGRGLSLALGCRSEIMKSEAQIGAYDSVIMPTLKMAAKGARALAVTDCLNFGSPEVPEIMSEFVASVEAITEAARAFETPVISGNVSFYNATEGKNIISTPATGLVGVRENIEAVPKDIFQEMGSKIFLLRASSLQFLSSSGATQDIAEMNRKETSSEKLKFRKTTGSDRPSVINFKELKDLQEALITMNQKNLILSSKTIGLSGVSAAIFKMLPKDLELSGWQTDKKFNDWQPLYQVAIEVKEGAEQEVRSIIERTELELVELGVLMHSAENAQNNSLGNYLGLDREFCRKEHESQLSEILEGGI